MPEQSANRSPFPGMDPYLERHWEDVHPRLISYIADALQPQLADDLVARIEEKVYIDDEDEIVQTWRKPDVHVIEYPQWAGGGAAAVATDESEMILLSAESDPLMERSVQIIDTDGHRVVTAIEVLSPWNKTPNEGRERYLRKREQYLKSDTNLVEIDLIRAGNWLSMIAPYGVPPKRSTTYRVMIYRTMPRDRAGFYPIALNQPLPTIRIPLRIERQEPEARLELQPLIDQVYRNGRYNRIDYTQPCDPPFNEAEAAWAGPMLAEAGRR